MKVQGIVKGSGPALISPFRRYDSFTPIEGPHSHPDGEGCCTSRSTILGIGVRRVEGKWQDELIVRCESCKGSYTVAP